MSITYSNSFEAFINETKNLLRLAVPIFIGQLCKSCLVLIDSIMSAAVGTVDLAAISLGATFWMPTILFGIGVTTGLAPIVAQLNGSNNGHKIPAVVHNSLFPILVIIVLTSLFLVFVTEEELKAKTVDYLFYIALAAPAIILFNVLKNTVEGLSIAVPSMVIGIATLILNIPINYIFIYGKFGMPAMGAVGCGLATAAVSWAALFMMYGYCIFSKKLSNIRLWQKFYAFDKQTIQHICAVGLPISIALIIETFSYAVLGYAITPFGSKTVAAHQIANVTCILVFMIPLSLASAIAIRTSQSLGEGSKSRAKRAFFSGLSLGLIFILTTAVIVYINRFNIISVFTTDPEVIGIAAPLFIAILIYQFQDAFFGATLGVVRGFKDTKFLMIVNIIIMWGIGIPLGYLLGLTEYFGKCYGIYGMWGILVVCYYLMTITFSLRSWWLFKNVSLYLSLPVKNDLKKN